MFIVLSFFLNDLVAVDIGSDSSVTRFNTQQILDDGDRIAGFAALEGGFELFNSTVSGLFDSFFPVTGVVQLNGGTLNLNQDLIFLNTSDFSSLGNINANSKLVQLSSTMNTIPSGIPSDCDISFLTETADLGPNVFAIDWSYDDKFIAAGMDNGAGDDVRVFRFDGQTLTEVASVALADNEVNSVSWHPSRYCLAVIRDTTDPQLLIYDFDGESTLTLIDSDGYGATNGDGVQWHPSGNFLAATNDANANEVFIYPVNSDCTLDIPGAVSFNITPNRNPDFNSIDWDLTGQYLAVGSRGATAGRIYVFEVGTSPLSISQNAFLQIGRVHSVSWSPTTTGLLVTAGQQAPEVRLYQHEPDAGTLTQISSISLGAVQGRGVDWGPSGGCIALGTNTNGAGGEFRTYQFDPRVSDFTLGDDFEIGSVTRAVKWSRNGKYVANGSNDDTVKVYSRDESFGSYIFSNIRFLLSSNVTLADCSITFTGQNLINGFGNTLSLSPSCTLKIGEEAGVLFQDLRILGMKEAKLEMLDSTSTASFKDVVMALDTDYTFTQGRLDVIRRLCIEGDSKSFIYESDQISTIKSTGIFEFGPGTTFRYQPSIASKTLINLADSNSRMVLNSATLSTSGTGIQLDMGKFIIEGRSFIVNEGSNRGEAVIFGDGINNLDVEWGPAANLEVTGQFVNMNIPC